MFSLKNVISICALFKIKTFKGDVSITQMADIELYYIILQMPTVPSNIIILVDLTYIKKSHRNKNNNFLSIWSYFPSDPDISETIPTPRFTPTAT